MNVKDIDVTGFGAVVWNKITITRHLSDDPSEIGETKDRFCLVAAFLSLDNAVDFALKLNEQEPKGGPASYWAEKTTGHNLKDI